MQVFLGFFGITRSLRHTAGSIARNIIAPLHEAGLPPRSFGHFHLPDVITNARSGEYGLPSDPHEADLLPLECCVVERQQTALVADTLALCRRYPDRFGDNYASAGNLCFQLRSLAQLWSLLALHMGPPDWVFFLRPDLLYLDRIDTAGLIRDMDRGRIDMAVPAWQHWGGLNDRLALCNASAAPIYANRIDRLPQALAAQDGLHAESLLAFAVRAAGARVSVFPHRAIRIRADGRPAPNDLRAFGLDRLPATPCNPQQPGAVAAS